ncbi:flagellar protein FlhE [Halomonas sp. M1]|uniref:flagellar protein FlhE n=1 Tax=Halomonas sp. M1 TaxID=3035470 RepID=UPI002485F609|nr:flagellar protein FlhE [Halomonas sp. M1]WFE70500.1 flagellar protein FlhE [Halomonas sp. M1]
MQRQSRQGRSILKVVTLSITVSLIAMGLASSVQAAPGSWSSQVPSVMVAMSDRVSSSQPIVAPSAAQVGNAVIDRIQWRYEAPPASPVNAWLCHPEQCIPLNSMRGSTMALAGKHADAPLYFRFALTPGQRPVRVQGLQAIVNYQ